MLDQANISVKVIIQAKQDLINTMTAKLYCQDKTPKMYWLIFEKKNKKKTIPNIPLPLVGLVGQKHISDFREKSETTKQHFSIQCILVHNIITLPVF